MANVANLNRMELLREFVSPKGERKIRDYVRPDGFFEYEEIFEAFDDIVGTYWSPGYQSGMFESESAVISELEATVPWISAEG